MKWIALGCLLLTTPLLAKDADLAGLYRCEGVSLEGATYTAYVQILPHDARYEVRWIFPGNDGQNAVGIGIVSRGVFSVAYSGGRTLGIVTYTITKGALKGEWADTSAEGLHKEVLTKLPAGHPVPQSEPEKPSGRPLPDRKGERQS